MDCAICSRHRAEGEDWWSCPRCQRSYCERCLEERRAAENAGGEASTTCCSACGSTLLVDA